ncbi:MAG: fibronectin type III domain-containing protein, partial [Candidatus Zixiibacteriota bacterium]
MKELGKYPLIGVLSLMLLLSAGCSREIENSVSPPIDSSTIPPTPSGLSAETGDGFAVLAWDISDVSLVSEYNIYRADSVGEDYSLVGNSPTESFTADGLQNGQLYYFRVSALNSAGYEGYKSDPVSAIPGLYGVLINGGAEYTNSRVVSLGFTAPIGTMLMQISNDSSFSGSQWET